MKLTVEDERRLVRLQRMDPGAGVLSVYLDVDPGLARRRGYVTLLMDALRDLKGRARSEDIAAIEVEDERLLAYVRDRDYVPHGRSVALFSSRPRRLLQAFFLQVPCKTLARFGVQPYVSPLRSALEDNPRTVVALADHEQARIISVLLGEIESERKVRGHVPGRQRQGGWAAFKYEADRAEHIRTHLRNVAAELRQADREVPFERLVLAGSDESTAALAKALPGSLRTKLAGSTRAEMFADSAHVVALALEVADAAERAEEAKLAEEIRDTALGGGRAALGWPETLQTLSEGRVHVLALAGDAQNSDRADEALRLALGAGARTEIVHGRAAEILAAYGGVGALLRY